MRYSNKQKSVWKKYEILNPNKFQSLKLNLCDLQSKNLSSKLYLYGRQSKHLSVQIFSNKFFLHKHWPNIQSSKGLSLSTYYIASKYFNSHFQSQTTDKFISSLINWSFSNICKHPLAQLDGIKYLKSFLTVQTRVWQLKRWPWHWVTHWITELFTFWF